MCVYHRNILWKVSVTFIILISTYIHILSSESYFVQKVDPSDSTDLACVVHKPNIPFCGSIEFSDRNVTKPVEEFLPYIGSDAISNG